MKILWISNIVFPEAIQKLTGNSEFKSSGGWMLGAALSLVKQPNISLAIATPTQLVSKLQYIEGEDIKYYLFPVGKGDIKYNKDYERFWKEINESFRPDIVHIHGTEFSRGLAYVNVFGAENVVVSIQGLISAISKYYNYGLSNFDIIRRITLRDLIRGSLFNEKRVFHQRGKYEIELIRKVSHIIGRTSWDKSCVWAINPSAKYHFCNETLCPEYYDGQWEYSKCIPHTSLISSASYPVKGFHQLLKALPRVLKEYPDTQIRVAGHFYPSDTFYQRMKSSGYSNYLFHLIKQTELESHITYMGVLSTEQMKNELLKTNLFVCPSTIENSSNSLCEAQILGVPVLASYVGGLPDLMDGDEEHMYRFEEIDMLSYKICEIFKAQVFSKVDVMRKKAFSRHNPILNSQKLLEIYNDICIKE